MSKKDADFESRDEIRAKEQGRDLRYSEVSISDWQFMRLIWDLYNPFWIFGAFLACLFSFQASEL